MMTPYDVCVDCYYTAGGVPIEDWTPDEPPLNRLDKNEMAIATSANDEGYFSNLPCPLCGSRLGGQRYGVVVTYIQ